MKETTREKIDSTPGIILALLFLLIVGIVQGNISITAVITSLAIGVGFHVGKLYGRFTQRENIRFHLTPEFGLYNKDEPLDTPEVAKDNFN